jgi:cytochrome c
VIFPEPVTLNRFLALELVLTLGIVPDLFLHPAGVPHRRTLMEPCGQSRSDREMAGKAMIKNLNFWNHFHEIPYPSIYFAVIMKRSTLLVLVAVSMILYSCGNKRSGKPRVLVFSKTVTFRHSSIPAGKAALQKLAAENDFLVDTTEDASYFNEDSLKNYSAVVFLNTTDTKDSLLNHYQQNAFERYIQAGGGFAGIHAATDAGYKWGWYTRLVGANFLSHPEQQVAVLDVVDKDHPSTRHLPDQWKRKDEWYNFQKLNPDVHVLIKIDENSYKGGANAGNHPMAWYHEYDGGRAFYTALGHTDESYQEENFLKHILGGIRYAIGDNENLDYSKVRIPKAPEEERFTKTVLKQGTFFEPTEMTILPGGDILIAQRRGEILLYRPSDTSLTLAGFLNVYHKTSTPNVNAEEGLLGIQADPDFAKNNFVYVFYSPVDTSVNRLSRFVFANNRLDSSSEKVILQFYSQREICCHTGGSIAFGKDRLLYLSTGDNTTPFDEPGQKYVHQGYGPLDDRPGHLQYDGARSAGNTNDLRGKILRIRINEDGSYSIPEGNLFPNGQDKTRPEIYVMGNRNPYRISVDKNTGFLYWGEVGPDAARDTATRGPRGYDEVNQARRAGFFGWPFFVGYNYAYRKFNYNTGESSDTFNPAHPVNNSRNNTGLKDLPSATPPLIYYPYAPSDSFPQVGSGGRNAMAGPVYYVSNNQVMPDYYHGKFFIYDWIRGWIKAVTLQPNGDFDKMEPFMPSTKLNALIDMEVGPDGKIYMLEYGSGWFSKNPDAALSRIDYNPGELNAKIDTANVAGQPKPAVDSAQFKQGHQEGHQQPDSLLAGKNLMDNSDCRTCHKLDEASIGPAYTAVAAKYKKDQKSVDHLVNKIINGGGGVWGETVMPAHPGIKPAEAKQIVDYILSLKKG